MSNLDKQLKDLQTKKLKSEYLKVLKTKIGDIASSEYTSIEKEIKDDIFKFLDNKIKSIENGTEIVQKASSVFNTKQVKILTLIANKALEKHIIKPAVMTETPVVNPIAAAAMATPDKIRFAMELRHLGGKEVKVASKGNSTGTVVGIDAPHVIVKLETGVTIHTTPEDLIY